jgi:predicted metalloprotease with PDZ domain
LPAVESALRQAQDPETVARLKRVGLHLHLKAETGFQGPLALLGIAFSLEPVQIGVHGEPMMSAEVVYTEPGFPAAEALRSGDRLVGMGGKAFGITMSEDNFRARISGSEAGSVVKFMVIRNGRLMQLAVRLAAVPAGVMDLQSYVDSRHASAAAYASAEERSVRPGVEEPLVLPDGSVGGERQQYRVVPSIAPEP